MLPNFPERQTSDERIALIRETLDAKVHEVTRLERELSELCALWGQKLTIAPLPLSRAIAETLGRPYRKVLGYRLEPEPDQASSFVVGLVADLLEANVILRRLPELTPGTKRALHTDHLHTILRILALGGWAFKSVTPGHRVDDCRGPTDWTLKIEEIEVQLSVEIFLERPGGDWEGQLLKTGLREIAGRFNSPRPNVSRVVHFILGHPPRSELVRDLVELTAAGTIDAIVLHPLNGNHFAVFGQHAPRLEPVVGCGRVFLRPPLAPIAFRHTDAGRPMFGPIVEEQKIQLQRSAETGRGAPRWKGLPDEGLGLLGLLNQQIREQTDGHPDLLPDFDPSQPLLAFSDYSGSHAGASFDAYSFLLVQPDAFARWQPIREAVRLGLGMSHRRMSFKGLEDGVKARALVPWLRMFQEMPGFLATVLVEKTLGPLGPVDQLQRDEPVYGAVKRQVLERMLRVCHLLSVFIGGLSSPYQNLLWISDQDEIAPNPERLTLLTRTFARVCSAYVPHPLGHLRCGTTLLDNGTLDTEDLTSLPDLVAGTLGELHTHRVHDRLTASGLLFVPPPEGLTPKTQLILSWLATTRQPMRRMTFTLTGQEGGLLTVRTLAFSAGPGPSPSQSV
ncbi:hypothetical protein [Oleiharenicola lentus]|uniref:hypothetical protein n=1 Tax=Oleiharenicola lentus TaxID=2508720 RepID=UPI003F681E9A